MQEVRGSNPGLGMLSFSCQIFKNLTKICTSEMYTNNRKSENHQQIKFSTLDYLTYQTQYRVHKANMPVLYFLKLVHLLNPPCRYFNILSPLRSDVLVIFTASSSSSGASSFLFCAKIALTLNLRKGFVASEATTSGLLHEGVGDMLSLRSHLTSASFLSQIVMS